MDLNHYSTLERRARAVREAGPNFQTDLKASTHRGQRPTIWVAAVLLGMSLLIALATFGVLYTARMLRGLGEEVPHQAIFPSNKLDKAITAVAIEVDPNRKLSRLLAADRQTFHCGKPIKDLYYWQRKAVSKLDPNLSDPNIVGLSAHAGHLAAVFEENGDPRRGVQLAKLPAKLDEMVFWSHPAIDTSYFAGIDDETASCMVWDARSGFRLIGGGAGVGAYDTANRRWYTVLTQHGGEIDSYYVNDLELIGYDMLVIAGDRGINLGRWSEGSWVKTCHLDRRSGLVGNNVRIIHETGSDAHLRTRDLTYLTSKRGLGWLRVDLANGKVGQIQGLIGEGRAYGLNRESLLRAGEDYVHDGLWMIYRAPRAKDRLLAALYQVADHQMSGLQATNSWPDSDYLTLSVDTFAEKPTAWVGGEGLRCIHAISPDSLEVVDAGLNESTVHEVIPTTSAIFVKAREAREPNTPICVYGALREDVSNSRGDPWRYCVGPRRFPGLNLGDITSVTDGTYEGQSALFLGTRDKGIGTFVRTSRELFKAFGPNATGADHQVPADGTLDICAAGPRLVQVASDRSLHFYNGDSWSTVIPSGGIRINPNSVTAVAAQGSHLVIGSAESISHYDATTHRWTELPPIRGLCRLVVAIDRLWAIDLTQALYSCALSEVIHDSHSSGRSGVSGTSGLSSGRSPYDPNVWVKEEPSVVDIYGDHERVLVIAKEGLSCRLWMKTLGESEKRIIVETIPLSSDQRVWTAAAVDGTILYVAPHRTGVGRYDLSTHKWTSISLPAGSLAVQKLMTTLGGLWLLDGGYSLFFLGKGSNEWEHVADQIARVNASHNVVMALTVSGKVLMSDTFTGSIPMRLLVGDGFEDSLADVRAGEVFKGYLFVATPARVGQYDVNTHSWRSYESNTIMNIAEFARSRAYLYARSTDGRLWRWTEDGNMWEMVNMAQGEKIMRVRQITGSGSSSIVALDTEGRLLVLSDSDKDHLVVVLEASRCPARSPLTIAAESGEDLMIASADGSVAAYTKAPGRPWIWDPVIEVGSEIDQLLACGGRKNRIVAVGDSKAVLLTKDTASRDWRVSRDVMIESGQIFGAVSDSDFYGLVQKGATDRWLLQATLPSDTEPSTEPLAPATKVIGERFPVSSRPATAAVCTDDKGRLFRADESGTVARYSFETHSWAIEPIRQVGQFLRVDEQLWAWSPSSGWLYQHLANKWQKDDTDWAHIVSDGKSMILADSHGQIVLRTAQGDRTIINAISEDLPVKSTDDIVALAEYADTLFVAVANGPLVSYNRSEHKWQVFSDVTSVNRFEKLSEGTGALFAVTRTGALLRFDNFSQNWIAALPKKTSVRAVIAAGDRLVVVTNKSHVLLLNTNAEIVTAHRPGMIEGLKSTGFDILAVTELDGQLLMLPRNGSRRNRLLVYDPQHHSWATRDLEGEADRFYHSTNGLWVATRQKNGSVRLSRIDVIPKLQIGVSVDGLLDVSSNGQTIVVVTADGRIRQLEADGNLTSIGVAESSLPSGRRIRVLMGVANSCVVLLDDGSVYHYTMRTRRWDRQIPPSPSGESRRIVNIGDGKAVLLVQSDVDIWMCDIKTATWTKLKPEGVVPLPSQSTNGGVHSDWRATGEAPNYQLIVRTGQRQLSMDLRDGRLGLDRANRVALQEGMLHVNTAVGTRTFRLRQSRWVEDEVIGTDFSYTKPDPVVFDGEVFVVSRHPEGPFQTASGKMAINIKVGRARPQILPTVGVTGLGFAHDVIRDIAISGRKFMLATAGGAVEMIAEGTSLKMEGIYEGNCGLADPNLVRILDDHGRLLVESHSGRCYASSSNGQRWNPIDSAQWKQAYARTSAITHYNSMLAHWRVRQEATGVELDTIIDTGPVPVSLSQKGFGFDRPKVFSSDNNGFRFYTLDGLVEIGRVSNGGPFRKLDPTYKLPSFIGFAEVLDSTRDRGMNDIWLCTTGAPYEAWSFDGQQWLPTSLEDYQRVFSRLSPYYWESPDIKWDREGRIMLKGKAPNATEITIHFDSVQGRFETDVVYDLAVFENSLWAVTKGGIIRFRSDGSWDHMTVVNSNGVAPTKDCRIWVVPMDKKPKLLLKWPESVLEWNGKRWSPPANPVTAKEAIARLEAYLVYGNTWRIERAKALTHPVPMQARVVPGQPFIEIKLRSDGLFDFESVHRILSKHNTCHVASDFGLSQIDPGKFEISEMAKKDSPAISLGQLDGKIYARLESGETLCYDDPQWRQHAAREDVFARIRQRIVKQSHWQLDREGTTLRVKLSPGPTSPWPGPDTLQVEVNNGRFDFDTVYDIGHADSPWLITDKGLLPRVGPDLRQIGRPAKTDAAANGRGSLSHLIYEDTHILLLKVAGELYYFSDHIWKPIPPSRREEVEKALVTQVAKGSHFEVSRSPGGQCEVHVRVGGPAEQYKRVEFDNHKGLFTFDVLTDVCQYAADTNALALIATEGGVAAYNVRSAKVDSQGGTGALRYLYCDVKSDGLGLEHIETVAYAKDKDAHFAASNTGKLYQLKGISGSGGSFGRWEPADESGRVAFEYSQGIIADDADGWQVTSRKQEGTNAPSSNRFETRWRGQTVRLVDLERTQDAAESISRFAHDIPLSAALLDRTLWVGTRGGVVLFTTSDPNRIDPTKFDILGEQTLSVKELTGDSSPKGIGFVRAGRSDLLIYSRRESDNAVLCCEVKNGGQEWRQIPSNKEDFVSACKVAEDPIWSWVKDSLRPVKLRPNGKRLHIPNTNSSYQFLVNGTWAFLEVNHTVARDPRRSIASFRDHLYIGTAGGVTRFTMAEAIGDRAGGEAHLDADIYAIAQSRMGVVPMLDIVAVYVDRHEDRLFALGRGGKCYVFDPNRNTWSLVWEGKDSPLDRAMVLVDNDLFHWRMLNDGEYQLRTVPLDVTDQSAYPLFQNGRFAFDEVHEFVREGDRLWVATDGGICMYSYPDYRPIRFYAQSILDTMRARGTATNAFLPKVHEVIRDRDKPSRTLCRTAAKDVYVFKDGSWKHGSDDSAFKKAYSRQTDSLMNWLEYPERRLEVQIAAIGQAVVLGTKGGKTKFALFRNNRFSFDDVRGAVLHGSILLTATPIGVVEQTINWREQQIPISRLYCRAENGTSWQEMPDLEHITRFSEGPILTWGTAAFSAVPSHGAKPNWQWQVYEQPVELIGPQMILEDGVERWKVTSHDGSNPMKVTRLRDGKTRAIASRFKCLDVSRAVTDDRWIYIPVPEPKGGLLRISKNKVIEK